MTLRFETYFYPGEVGDLPHLFDMVSEDESIIGEAMYLSGIRGRAVPTAKHSAISEAVWLLSLTPADTLFIVFGNDFSVPTTWLRKYGAHLDPRIRFFFMFSDGTVDDITPVQARTNSIAPRKTRVRVPMETPPLTRAPQTAQQVPVIEEPDVPPQSAWQAAPKVEEPPPTEKPLEKPTASADSHKCSEHLELISEGKHRKSGVSVGSVYRCKVCDKKYIKKE